VKVEDQATLPEALAKVDQIIFESPSLSPFSKENTYIRSYLQLFWDPKEQEIYDDIKAFGAGPHGIIPLKERPDFNLYDDSEISLTSSS